MSKIDKHPLSCPQQRRQNFTIYQHALSGPAYLHPMQIFLTGYMGSGKSTVGLELSELLNLAFVDLDAWIEEHSGLTVQQWFEELGEDEFRLEEAYQLEQVITLYPNAVVATGGGTPCFQDNFNLMQENGLTVYLQWSEADLFDHLSGETAHRPLLQGMSDDDIRSFIGEHLPNREPIYLLSDMVIDMAKTSNQQLANQIDDHTK